MSPKAFTPWWRLLHDSIGTANKSYRWNLPLYPSPLYSFYDMAKEDVYHMIVGCSIKSVYWANILRLMQHPDSFHSPEAVWLALICFSTTDAGDLIQPELFCAFGSDLATLWRYHWRCKIDLIPWHHDTAVNLFRQDYEQFFPSFLVNEDRVSDT